MVSGYGVSIINVTMQTVLLPGTWSVDQYISRRVDDASYEELVLATAMQTEKGHQLISCDRPSMHEKDSTTEGAQGPNGPLSSRRHHPRTIIGRLKYSSTLYKKFHFVYLRKNKSSNFLRGSISRKLCVPKGEAIRCRRRGQKINKATSWADSWMDLATARSVSLVSLCVFSWHGEGPGPFHLISRPMLWT